MKLVAEFDAEFVICTSPSRSPSSLAGKLRWLQAKLGPTFNQYVMTSDKSPLASASSILIDDSDSNCQEQWGRGASAILFPQAWNRNKSGEGRRIDFVRGELADWQRELDPPSILKFPGGESKPPVVAETKESNPKDAIGSKKVGISVLSMPVLLEDAVGMTEGSCKYGSHNYREIGVSAKCYFDATIRHLFAWWEGENLDPDSGLSHLTKARSSLMVLRDAMIRGKMTDDRPTGTNGFVQALNEKMLDVLRKHPNPVRPFLASREADSYVFN